MIANRESVKRFQQTNDFMKLEFQHDQSGNGEQDELEDGEQKIKIKRDLL